MLFFLGDSTDEDEEEGELGYTPLVSKPAGADGEEGEDDIAAMMGFGGFDSTKVCFSLGCYSCM